MSAGPLDQLVTLEAKAITKGAAGGMVETWEPVPPQMWASIRHLAGGQKRVTRAGGGEVYEDRTEIRMRWRPGVTAAMRVVHGSVAYNIQHCDNTAERGEWLVLTCQTGVNRG